MVKRVRSSCSIREFHIKMSIYYTPLDFLKEWVIIRLGPYRDIRKRRIPDHGRSSTLLASSRRRSRHRYAVPAGGDFVPGDLLRLLRQRAASCARAETL